MNVFVVYKNEKVVGIAANQVAAQKMMELEDKNEQKGKKKDAAHAIFQVREYNVFGG